MKANLVLSISFLTLLGSIGFPAASGQLSTNLDSNQEETSFSHINEHQYEVLASEFTLEEIQEIDKVSSEYEVWELTQAIEDPQQYIARKHSFFRAATNGCSFSLTGGGMLTLSQPAIATTFAIHPQVTQIDQHVIELSMHR